MGAQDNQLRLVTQDPKGKPRIQARLGSGNTIRVAGITNPISKAPAPGKFLTHPCEYLPSWSYYPYDILLSLSPQHPKHVPRIDKILRSCTLALHPCLGLGEGAHTYAWLSREAHHGALPALGTASPGRTGPVYGGRGLNRHLTHTITAVSWSYLGEQLRTASADQPLIARSPVISGGLITQMDFLAFN